MDKAYDLKALGEMIAAEAKKDGLAVAEEAMEKLGKAVYFATQKWAIESAKLSGSKLDDLVAPFYHFADSWVQSQLEKIDLGADKSEGVSASESEPKE